MISSQFIQSCQSGDENAIQTLVRTYQRAVFQLALSVIDDGQTDAFETSSDEKSFGFITGSGAAAEAEAATRETFIRAIDRMGRYREDTNFETWLYEIAIRVSQKRARSWKFRRGWSRLFRSAWRGITRRPPAPPPVPAHPLPDQPGPAPAEPDPAQQTAPQQFAAPHPIDADLWASVRRLDEKLRIPVVLRYYHDYPISEIARLLHISEGTVHARLDAAREKIALKG